MLYYEEIGTWDVKLAETSFRVANKNKLKRVFKFIWRLEHSKQLKKGKNWNVKLS